MSAADLITRLAQGGIDASLLAEVAQELFSAEIERKSLADRRQHERDRKAKSRDITGRNGKSRAVRGPPKEKNIIQTSGSEDKSSGGAAADPVKEMFDSGVALLTSTGLPEKQARSLVGKWCKDRSAGEVIGAFADCRAKAIVNPVEWLTKRFTDNGYVSASGYRYRGDDQAVMREAEKRADWGTYWKAKSNVDGERRASNG